MLDAAGLAVGVALRPFLDLPFPLPLPLPVGEGSLLGEEGGDFLGEFLGVFLGEVLGVVGGVRLPPFPPLPRPFGLGFRPPPEAGPFSAATCW